MTKVETKTQVGSWEDGFSPSSNQKPKKASKVKNELLTEVASDTTIHNLSRCGNPYPFRVGDEQRNLSLC